MATRKSRFDHLLFLQKVNECPFLYDINDVNYKDMMLKEARWTEIGAAFQMSGPVAQLKWKSLRDRFTREKKKYEDLRRNSEDEVPPPKWWLFTIIGKVLDRNTDSKSLLTNGDGFEERDNDVVYGQTEKKPYVPNNNGDGLSSFSDYHNNNINNHHHHLRNRRHNNTAETSRSSMCSSADHPESDTATPADGDAASGAAAAAAEIASAVHCEVRIDDDEDDDELSIAPSSAANNNQFQQHQHSSYKRKRSHVEDTMTEWTYQLTNCLLQRIVEIYPPTNNGISAAAVEASPAAAAANNNSTTDGATQLDDVEYYVRSLAPRLRRLKAKDRGLVRLKIESALYEIESAVDE